MSSETLTVITNEKGERGNKLPRKFFHRALISAINQNRLTYSAQFDVGSYANSQNTDGLFSDLQLTNRSYEEAYHLLLKSARQKRSLTFQHTFTRARIKNLIQIGYGAYGQVFGFRNEKTVIKLMPFGGGLSFSGRSQMRTFEVLSEVTATQAVSQLHKFPLTTPLFNRHVTQNVVRLQRVSILQGPLPSYIIAACNAYYSVHRPSLSTNYLFPTTQKWVVLEFDYGGEKLMNKLPSCLHARLSIFAQTALALAVAERRVNFEHRDLHCGNILLKPVIGLKACINPAPISVLDGEVYRPCSGPSVSIIDFAFSRFGCDETPVFTDMTKVCELARLRNSAVDIIYTEMGTEVENRWWLFRPRTNCMWLKFLAMYLWHIRKYRPCSYHPDTQIKAKWEAILNLLQFSNSAADFVHKASYATSFLFR